MAQQIGAREHIFRYRNFTILKDQTLGHGSYGAVYKARCDQLVCAAKVLHPTIVDPYDPGSGMILQRFQQECDFLNRIRHPHIVQYLGVCRDPESNLPVLLMELLDESLTNMLERSQHPISYHIQVDLCHDVSLAVSYLHSNGIIHRDLSGNNVLVIAGRRAKVTDFGMSKLVGSNRHMTPLTFCPGTQGYMSPESLKEPPRYTEKLDVFSEGVIMIQVCTRQFPDPGPAMKEVQHPISPVGTIQVPVPEPERRKKHIDSIAPTHPLLPIATECLEYREKDRPSAEELCQRLAALKENPEYIESSQHMSPATSEANRTLQQERDELARQVEEKDREISAKDQQIAANIQELAAKDQQIIVKDEDLTTKNQQILAIGRDNNRLRMQVSAKDQENERLRTQLRELNQRHERVTAEFQETNQQLRRQNKDLKMQNEDLQRQLKLKPEPPKEIEFKWREDLSSPFSLSGVNAPFRAGRGSGSSVVNSNVACYFSSSFAVYLYYSSTRLWITLPKCPQAYGSLAVVQGLLTMVGGQPTFMTATNKLVSLLNERGEWVEQFPPMPTSRYGTTATTYQNHLIVAGGTLSMRNTDNLNTVELLNTDTLVWSTAASLPHPFAYAAATICGDRLYMLGGLHRNGKCRSVFSCSLPELLQLRSTLSRVWQRDTDIAVYESTCVAVHGQLVAVSGQDEDGKKTTAVYKYNPNAQSWNVISHMTTARNQCYVAVANNQLITVGGYVRGITPTDSVEIAEF